MKWLLILFLITSCIRTEILNAPIEREIDTISVTRADTTIVEPPDTTYKVPIGFNPSVGGWNGADIDIDL